MTLTDTGPLIALIDADQADHQACLTTLGQLRLALVTTWPVLTETMYLLGRAGGFRAQQSLWQLVLSGRLELLELSPSAMARAAALMAKYADRPMDLADATLVAVAEERGERRIFTLDADFDVYRLHGRRRFEVLPSVRD